MDYRAIQELEGKVGFIFKDSMDSFASNFQSNGVASIEVLRELSQWLKTSYNLLTTYQF